MILIRLMLSSNPIYQMSMSILLEGVKRKLHGLFSCFLWKGSIYKKKDASSKLGIGLYLGYLGKIEDFGYWGYE